MSFLAAGSPAPDFSLTAVVSKRSISPSNIPGQLLLIFHGYQAAALVGQTIRNIRHVYPDPRQLLIASVADMRIVPRLLRGMAEKIMRDAYHQAAARGATAVHRLRLQVGEMSGVETDLLRSAYETFSDRSICADAVLEIVPVPVRWGCPACGTEVAAGNALRCAGCGGPARLTAGDELVLERIEMEVPDV